MAERLDGTTGTALDRAAEAIRDGELVVYPTETVYGLGADALDTEAIESVFGAKDRPRDDPVSLAVPSVDVALEYVAADPSERSFMEQFLPGPVTVVLEKREVVPAVLTGGQDRVGVRVPDHEIALGLLERAAPITATSANVSGNLSVTALDELDPAMAAAAAVLLDGGETPGTGSTVVDVSAGTIHRRGQGAEAVDSWLQERT